MYISIRFRSWASSLRNSTTYDPFHLRTKPFERSVCKASTDLCEITWFPTLDLGVLMNRGSLEWNKKKIK